VRDLSQELIQATLDDIWQGFQHSVNAGLLGKEAAAEARARLSGEVVLENAVIAADLVFDALPDNLALRRELFHELDHLCPPQTLLVSTTAVHSISELGSVTTRPELCVGMHWFGDPQMTDFVEIVQGIQTAENTLELAKDVAGRLRQDWIVVKDREGFVVNRAVMALILECIRLVEEGVVEASELDRAIAVAIGTSPMALADTLGLEKVAQRAQALREAYGDRFLAPQSLETLVKAHAFGKSTGSGFFHYGE
jgi:3-hydroxybutyryl-CoA dehydrogenase